MRLVRYSAVIFLLLNDPIVAQNESYLVTYSGDERSLAYIGARRFSDCFNSVTGGQQTMELLNANSIGNVGDIIDLTRNGRVEFSVVSDGYQDLGGGFSAFSLPFLVESQEGIRYVRQAHLDALQSSAEENGIQLLDIWDSEPYGISSHRPVNTAADLEGIKFRTPNRPEYLTLFENLGASTTSVDFNDVFQALETGVIDAQEMYPSEYAEFNFYDVAKYYTASNHRYVPTMFVASPDFISSLSNAQREVIQGCGVEAGSYTFDYGAWQAEANINNLQNAGVSIYDFSENDVMAFRSAAAPVYSMTDLPNSAEGIVSGLAVANAEKSPPPVLVCQREYFPAHLTSHRMASLHTEWLHFQRDQMT